MADNRSSIGRYRFIILMMTLGGMGDDSNYWSNLQGLVNDLHDNILVKAQEEAGGTLNDSELNLLALYCCGFSRTVIMVTMGYRSIGTVYNKKMQIAKKLHVNDLDDFLGHGDGSFVPLS